MGDFSQDRMNICSSCPYNLDTICILCGCNIEVKTKDPGETCPHTPSFWGAFVEAKLRKQSTQIKIAEQAPSAAPQFNKSNECIPCNKHRH